MQCSSCGTTLAPGTTVCPRCGTDVSYLIDTGEIAYLEYSPAEKEPAPPASQVSGTAQEGYSSTETEQESPLTDDNMQFSALEQQPPHEPALDEVVPPVPQRPRKFSVITVLLLIILVLVLIIGGSGLVYFATIFQPREFHTQATAVAQAVLKKQAQGTAVANFQASATVTATSPRLIYTRATSGTPVINDPLDSPDGSIWYHYNSNTNSCAFAGGAYHLKIFVKGGNSTCFAFNSLFKNLAFQVKMTILNGDAGGLLFSVSSGFYLFLIARDGSYSLFLGNGAFIPLASGTSSAINKRLNQVNLLSVVAFDGNMYLFINKQPVAHTFDDTLSSGQIGLFAGSQTGLTDVAFNNVQVWSI